MDIANRWVWVPCGPSYQHDPPRVLVMLDDGQPRQVALVDLATDEPKVAFDGPRPVSRASACDRGHLLFEQGAVRIQPLEWLIRADQPVLDGLGHGCPDQEPLGHLQDADRTGAMLVEDRAQ